MKKLSFIIIVGSLFAQNGIAIISGLNNSKIKYNESFFPEYIFDIASKPGLSISAEKRIGAIKLGGGFIQRGTKISEKSNIPNPTKVSWTSNYFSIYTAYSYSINRSLAVFSGIQAGYVLGFQIECSGSDCSEINEPRRDDFNNDLGLLLGFDYLFNKIDGLRLSYYRGVINVDKMEDEEYNFKNISLEISILYNFDNN